MLNPKVENRIKEYVIESTECINFNYLNKEGYGVIQYSEKGKKGRMLAHRASYIIFNGELSNTDIVRHVCDNPSCINPRHLIKGSHIDNVKDRISRNRSAVGNNNGRYIDGRTLNKIIKKHSYNRKLNDSQVLKVLNLLKENKSCGEISKIMNVKETLIRDISSGRTYKHIQR